MQTNGVVGDFDDIDVFMNLTGEYQMSPKPVVSAMKYHLSSLGVASHVVPELYCSVMGWGRSKSSAENSRRIDILF